MTQIRTHRIARKAFELVQIRSNSALKDDYKSLALRLPGMILQNGLAQATGFLLAKGSQGNAHYALLDDLNELMKSNGCIHATRDRIGFHQSVIEADLENTMLMTRLAAEAGSWIKRYVQATSD